jgi:hypothetical protein
MTAVSGTDRVGPPEAADIGGHVATSVELSDPTDRRAARRVFIDLVVANPATEFALMTSGITGERFILRGTARAVRGSLSMVARMAELPSRWCMTADAWSRAVDMGRGYVPEHRRIPTADGDFTLAAAIAARTERSVRMEIHFIDEHHQHAVTTFGIDPDEPRPFHVDVPRLGRQRDRLRFATLDTYRGWVRGTRRARPDRSWSLQDG